MLAHARLRDLPLEDYINPSHPIQQSILAAFAEMCGLSVDQVELGIDGCSAPNFAVPLRNAAWAYARLCDPTGLPEERAQACQRITRAMTSNPMMVAGPNRFDTNLMELGSGRILSKGGAEGYQGLGIMPGALSPGSPALGIAFKVIDGDLEGRARPLASLEILHQLGAISKQEMESMTKYRPRPITNWRKIEVGQLRPSFTLEKVSA
jgi:L-asparaginase II